MKKTHYLALLLTTLPTPALVTAHGQELGPSAQSQPYFQDSHQQGATPEAGGAAAMGSTDHRFLREAAKGGLEEVALGRLAAERGSNAEVRRFGQRMVADHGKANGELLAIAARKGIALPPEASAAPSTPSGNPRPPAAPATGAASGQPSADQPDARTGETQSEMQTDRPGAVRQPGTQIAGPAGMEPDDHHAAMERLARLSGEEFDREYLRAELADHEKTIALFEQQVSRGADADLQAFARKTLPTLREHRRMAESLARSVGVGESGR